MPRREALRLMSASALLTLGTWPGHANDIACSDRFRFIVVNDTHYMSEECGAWLERVVAQMRRHRNIDFCLLVGDLVEKGLRDHLGAVKEIFAGLGKPVHAVPGNHDYLTMTYRTAYDDLFAGQSNYSFEHRGWQFVGLDSTQGSAYEKTKIQPATLRWVDEQAAKLDRKKPLVLFTHFPLGAKVRYQPLNADDLLDKFRPFNLRAVFNGHFHSFTERQFQGITVTTNKCCALKRGNHDKTKEKGYFLCTAENGVVSRRFIEVLPAMRNQPGRRVTG